MIHSEAWLLLTTGSVWQLQLNRAFGVERGFEAITSDDVKLALQGLPTRPTLYGFAAFLGDVRALEELSRIEHLRLIDRAIDEQWESRRGEQTLRRLVTLALYETIGGQRCPGCLGRGQIRVGRPGARVLLRYRRFIDYKRRRALATIHDPEAWTTEEKRLRALRDLANQHLAELDAGSNECEPCGACYGAGKVKVTETLRARLSGIPRRTWYRGWDERYARFFSELQRLEAWAIGHVKGRLRELAA